MCLAVRRCMTIEKVAFLFLHAPTTRKERWSRLLEKRGIEVRSGVFLDRMTSTRSLAFEPEWEKFTLRTEPEED